MPPEICPRPVVLHLHVDVCIPPVRFGIKAASDADFDSPGYQEAARFSRLVTLLSDTSKRTIFSKRAASETDARGYIGVLHLASRCFSSPMAWRKFKKKIVRRPLEANGARLLETVCLTASVPYRATCSLVCPPACEPSRGSVVVSRQSKRDAPLTLS